MTEKVPTFKEALERAYAQISIAVNLTSTGVAGLAIARTFETGNLLPGAVGVGVAALNIKTLLSMADYFERKIDRGE